MTTHKIKVKIESDFTKIYFCSKCGQDVPFKFECVELVSDNFDCREPLKKERKNFVSGAYRS